MASDTAEDYTKLEGTVKRTFLVRPSSLGEREKGARREAEADHRDRKRVVVLAQVDAYPVRLQEKQASLSDDVARLPNSFGIDAPLRLHHENSRPPPGLLAATAARRPVAVRGRKERRHRPRHH